jgi:2'-5' RNA ligase
MTWCYTPYMSELRYAVWYEPTGETYTLLNAIIRKLAALYHSPVFEPHITLLPGGTTMDLTNVKMKLEKIIAATLPFETEFSDYDYLDDYFKCIFVHVKEKPEILDFAKAIQQEINGKPSNDFSPHLSVVYGQLPIQEKESIIKSLESMRNKHFTIDKVHIIQYECNKPPESWKKVASVLFNY